MRSRANPVLRLLQALALAATGFLLSAGAAMAHGGHSSGHAAGHVRPAAAVSEAATSSQDTVVDVAGTREVAAQPCAPCPSGQGGEHHGVDCCAVACHAALAAPAVGPLPRADGPVQPDGIAHRLDSRLGDRTERPPRRS